MGYEEMVFRTPEERTDSINTMNNITGGPLDVQDGLVTRFGNFLGEHMIYIQVIDKQYAIITAIGPDRGWAWLERYE